MGHDFECALEKIGGWGRYQKLMVPLICLFFIPMGFFVFAPVFTYLTPPHRCYIPDVDGIESNATTANFTVTGAYIPYVPSNDGTLQLASCVRYVKPGFHSEGTNVTTQYGNVPLTSGRETERCLDGWVYMDDEGRTTSTSEFDLVCENAWKKPLLTSGLIVGLFLGSIISGPVTDRYGRRIVCLVNMVLHAVLVLAFSFIPTYELLVAMIIVIGTSHIVWYSCTFVLVQELVDRKHRAAVACITNVLYAVGYMILPGFGFLFMDWRWIVRTLALASLVFLPYIFFLPESPRWLASQGRHAEAYEIMRRIARFNGTDEKVLDGWQKDNMDVNENLIGKPSTKSRERRKSSVQLLARNSVMRWRSLLICWVWNVTFLCYYALGLNTSNLGGNKYWNCFVAAALEIPCYFFVTSAIQKFGRRSSLTSLVGLAGLFLALSPAFGAYDAVTVTFAMVGKFFAASSMGILYLYTSELYPTPLRNTGIGLASMSSRFGSICAPFLVFAGENSGKYIPFYVMAGLGLLTAVLCLFLPETKQSPLPDTLLDAVNLENFRLFSCTRETTKERKESQAALTNNPEDSRNDDVPFDVENEAVF